MLTCKLNLLLSLHKERQTRSLRALNVSIYLVCYAVGGFGLALACGLVFVFVGMCVIFHLEHLSELACVTLEPYVCPFTPILACTVR